MVRPRVGLGAAGQPWALGRNPVGIGEATGAETRAGRPCLLRRRLVAEGGEEFFFLIDEGFFAVDFALEAHEAFEEGFWARRAAGDVDVDWDDAVDALEDGVGAVHAAGGGAGTHGDAPFWFRHLVPDAFDGEGHFVGDGASDDHDVGLARGEAHDFGAEAGDVVAAGGGGHEFDGAAGEAHGHGPEGVFPHPVDGGVEPCEDDVPLDFRIVGGACQDRLSHGVGDTGSWRGTSAAAGLPQGRL